MTIAQMLLLITAATTASAGELPISLEIVPTDGAQDVSVRITNVSSKAIRLFEDVNSWGWSLVTLRVTLADGTVYPLPRTTAKCWSANWPSTILLNPKEVYDIQIEPFPENYFIQHLKLKDRGSVKLSVVYAPSREAVKAIDSVEGQRQLWLGTIESTPIPFRF